MDGSAGEFAGANRVAGGEDVDEMAIKLGQGSDLDPVSIAGNWLGAVLKRVVVVIVARIAKRYKSFAV